MAEYSSGGVKSPLVLLFIILFAGALLWMISEIREGRFLYTVFFGVRGQQVRPYMKAAALLLIVFMIGALRMMAELKPYPIEVLMEADARAKRTTTASVEGSLDTETLKNGSYTLVLKDPVILTGEKEYGLPALTVSVDESVWKEAVEEGLAEEGLAGEGAVTGMGVRFRGKLELFSAPRNPGEFDYGLYYRSMKLRCRLKANNAAIYDTEYIPAFKWVKRFRVYVSEALSALCSEEDRGIYKAVLLGDKTELLEDIRELYQKNGIAHLLAVSGLHVSLIGMGIYGGLRRTGLGFGKAGILAGCVIFFYGCVTGFGPSVFRAVFMIFCSFLASYLGRTYDLLSAMSLALLLLILDAPFLLFTSGLQLSFGAVLAIGIGSERRKEWKAAENNGDDKMAENSGDSKAAENSGASKPGSLAGIFETIWTSLFIQLLTYPVIIYHFFEFPIYGIILNLFVIPLMAYVVGAGIAAVFLYGISRMLALAVMGTGHYILVIYHLLCSLTEKLPFYSMTAGRPKLWAILLYYLVMLFFLYRSKGNVRRQKFHFLIAGFCAAIFLMIHPVSGLEVSFLDVGQGDGIFLQTAGGNILVDGGSSQIKNLGKNRLVPFLKSKGISRLDFVFVSHGDKDHISGIEYILEEEEAITIKNLVFSCLSAEDESCKKMAELAGKRGGTVWYMEEGQSLKVGKLSLTGIYPRADGGAVDKNEQSLVLLAGYGDFSMLLTGDVENIGEGELLLIPEAKMPGEKAPEAGPSGVGLSDVTLPRGVTVLKAAHHGSKTSSGQEFLERVSPKITILSYGEGNSYGHPSTEVVKRLEEMETEIWRTAVSGAITVITDGKHVSVSGFVGERVIDHGVKE